MMRATGMPSGLAALGYRDADVSALVEGAFAQQRLLANAPLAIGREELDALFRDAFSYW
jgi:alcohol dehydrogenase class IV